MDIDNGTLWHLSVDPSLFVHAFAPGMYCVVKFLLLDIDFLINHF
jgi:hypothetical protein